MRGCTTCSIIFALEYLSFSFFQCIFHYLGFVQGLFVHCLGSFSRLRSRHEDFLAVFYRNKAEKMFWMLLFWMLLFCKCLPRCVAGFYYVHSGLQLWFVFTRCVI